MPTINIKSAPYNAVGDTQCVQTNCSITSGSHTLTTSGGIFVFGDVGKVIFMGANPGATDIDGITAFGTTISAFTSATQVTLTDAAPATITALSRFVTWGTPDDTPFMSFNSDFQGVSNVTLSLPAGGYLFNAGGVNFSSGIPGLIVSGAGQANTFVTGAVSFGSGSNQNTLSLVSIVATRPAGSATLTQNLPAGRTTLFIAPADTAILTSGQKYWLAGIDTQGFGYPQNPAFFDLITVTGINAGTGQVDYTPANQFAYKTTWPTWNGGDSGNPNLGGPGTLFAHGNNNCTLLTPTLWNNTFRYNDLTVNVGGSQVLMSASTIIWTDVTFNGLADPSDNENCQFIRCTCGVAIEIDKLIKSFTADTCTLRQLQYQSQSCQSSTLINTTVSGSLVGTGANMSIVGCTIVGAVALGPTANGIGVSATLANSRIGEIIPLGVLDNGFTVPSVTLTSTQMIVPHSYGIPRWGVPGATLFFGKITGYDGMVRLTDITADGSLNAICTISAPFGLPGSLFTDLGTPFTISVSACPNLRVTNCDILDWDAITTYALSSAIKASDGNYYVCIVSSSLNDPPPSSPTQWLRFSTGTLAYPNSVKSYTAPGAQGKAYGTYSIMSFDGTMSAHGNTTTWTKPWGNFNIGRLISLKVTVSQAYSGVGALSFDPLSTFGNPPVMDPTQTTLFPWSISVDLRTTGVRTITPTQITGSAGADSLGIAPGNVWFGGPVGPSISRDVSAESPANWPLFEVEIMTDQGFQPSVVTLMGQSWT